MGATKNLYKIAKNRPILKKLTVPSRQEFAIFKNPRFLNIDKSLWPILAEVSVGAFFCTTELSTQTNMKWALKTLLVYNSKP